MSRTLTLTTSSRLATWSSASSSRPMRTRPSRMAMVAGTAPRERTMSSTSVATRRFSGRGRPWLMMVDSRATTAAPAASASDTSSVIWTSPGSRGCRVPVRAGAEVVTGTTLPARSSAAQPPGSPPGAAPDQNGHRVGPGLPAGLGGRCPAAGRPPDPPPADHARATGMPCARSTRGCRREPSTSGSSRPSRSSPTPTSSTSRTWTTSHGWPSSRSTGTTSSVSGDSTRSATGVRRSRS